MFSAELKWFIESNLYNNFCTFNNKSSEGLLLKIGARAPEKSLKYD